MRGAGRNNAVCFESLEKALGDSPETYGHLDLIVFGFPCQDISGANPKGEGLKGKRSSIFFECMRIVNILNPQWLLIENVPRLLSINGGADFATVLQTLSESGYGYSWRILDSQYFGVAQRRKRVFIVGYFGGLCPPEILFEQKGGCGNDKKVKNIRARWGGVSSTIKARDGQANSAHESYITERVSPKITDGDKGVGMLICETQQAEKHGRNSRPTLVAQTIGSTPRGNTSFVWQDTYITETNSDRKREITGIPPGMDTCRGIVIGNAVTVNVAEWIGRRIKEYVEKEKK